MKKILASVAIIALTAFPIAAQQAGSSGAGGSGGAAGGASGGAAGGAAGAGAGAAAGAGVAAGAVGVAAATVAVAAAVVASRESGDGSRLREVSKSKCRDRVEIERSRYYLLIDQILGTL